MIRTEKADLRWGVERRLECIGALLFWGRHMNQDNLMEAFGMSENQASADLTRYIGMVPNNIVYDIEFADLTSGDCNSSHYF